MPTYFIGDVHGCKRTLEQLLARLDIRPGDKAVFLGDLIDRGSDSKGVIDTIWQLKATGIEIVCLRGNHEQMLLDVLEDPALQPLWRFRNGGEHTLKSFGAEDPSELPTQYMDFFRAMPLWYETDGFLCVHAGLNFNSPDPLADEYAMLWIRYWYDNINYSWLGERILLHGHTPMPLQVIEEQHQLLDEQQYLNLDNGCVYQREGLGHLLALRSDTRSLFLQPFVG
ncbi:MAG: serine/threonine protein phosphatase [Saprospiraceae bacterium]|nr:serine/threonine protein phosphatase [Saprospiraceae bacterium]MDW8484251.1 metallophosphoesterase family protein [Saprospiraceae bacterium]